MVPRRFRIEPIRILVTGAAGFIGKHLTRRLHDTGCYVISIDLPPLEAKDIPYAPKPGKVFSADITNLADLQEITKTEHFDSVVHLAALAAPRVIEKDPDSIFKVNVQGTYNILKIAQHANAQRIIFTSTAHVYGISPKYFPTDETHPLTLQDAYTSSKIIGEQLCELFYRNHNMSYAALRLYNGYGPGQSRDYFIPAIIYQAMKDQHIVLQGRKITKDFVYVDDVVDAIIRALKSDYVGPLNIGTGRQVSLEYVARQIADTLHASLSFAETEDKGPTHMQCDPTRTRSTLGWMPQIPIEKGLAKTITDHASLIKERL